MQRRSKKGFTLAELLIVVAIIAVLVAIAVPLFVSALSDSKKAVFENNQRTLKSAAVVYILTNNIDVEKESGSGTKQIQAKATVSATGDISNLTVEFVEKVTETAYEGWEPGGEIIVEVKPVDLEKKS